MFHGALEIKRKGEKEREDSAETQRWGKSEGRRVERQEVHDLSALKT